MIKITEAACAQIKEQSKPEDLEKLGLRIAAKPDTKGSIEYGMGFDDRKDDDLEIQYDGFSVLVSPHSEELLEGAVMDFVEIESGVFEFIFLNPNDPQFKAPTLD